MSGQILQTRSHQSRASVSKLQAVNAMAPPPMSMRWPTTTLSNDRTWNKAADHVKHRSDCITSTVHYIIYITTPPPLSKLHYCQHWLHYYSPNIVQQLCRGIIAQLGGDMVVFFISRTKVVCLFHKYIYLFVQEELMLTDVLKYEADICFM